MIPIMQNDYIKSPNNGGYIVCRYNSNILTMIRMIMAHPSISGCVHQRYVGIDQCVHIPKG